MSAPDVPLVEWRKGELLVSTDPARFDVDVIHGFLATSTWAAGVPRATVERSIAGSLGFGLYEGPKQIGFARVVTDYATFAYLCDVFVLEAHRGRGHSRWLMECVMAHPRLQGLRRWMLATSTAPWLYAKLGWKPLARPEIFMEVHDAEVYRRPRSAP